MPIELTLTDLPGGYAVSAGRPGEQVQVAFREFLSSEDGDDFLRRLEGFPTIVLSELPAANRPAPSQIDHMLVLVHPDRKCQVYVNELVVIGEALARRDLAAGQMVFDDDLAGIRRIKFKGVEIPKEAGIFYLFSLRVEKRALLRSGATSARWAAPQRL